MHSVKRPTSNHQKLNEKKAAVLADQEVNAEDKQKGKISSRKNCFCADWASFQTLMNLGVATTGPHSSSDAYAAGSSTLTNSLNDMTSDALIMGHFI